MFFGSCICFALQRGVESQWELDGSGRRGDGWISGIATLGVRMYGSRYSGQIPSLLWKGSIQEAKMQSIHRIYRFCLCLLRPFPFP